MSPRMRRFVSSTPCERSTLPKGEWANYAEPTDAVPGYTPPD
jgi:hypothetical protein